MSREEAARKNQEGLKLLEQGKYEEALRKFDEAIEIDPENASAWLNRSNTYRELGREAEADTNREMWKSLMIRTEAMKYREQRALARQDYHEDKTMSWFQRHLNWTFVFASILALLISSIITTRIVGITPDEVLIIAWPPIGIIIVLPVAIWVLKQKDRSLWWYFVLFVPFIGFIIFITLENYGYLAKPGNKI